MYTCIYIYIHLHCIEYITRDFLEKIDGISLYSQKESSFKIWVVLKKKNLGGSVLSFPSQVFLRICVKDEFFILVSITETKL